jgi:hypothetical protein
MRVLGRHGPVTQVELSEEELVTINNALNEARLLVPRTEFGTRMGADVRAVTSLMIEIQAALELFQS